MAYKVISISLKNQLVIHYLEEFKRNGGNVSGLIESLLEKYFLNSDRDKELLTKEMMTLLEIKDKLNEFLKWKEEIEPKLSELEQKLREKQEQQKQIDQAPLIRELRHVVFEDLDREGLENFKATCRRIGRDPQQAIMVRLSTFAAEKNISIEEAKELFLKAFPEISSAACSFF